MRQTIRTRMILWIVLPTLLIFAAVSTAALVLLQRVEVRHMQARMAEQARSYATQFDLHLREAAAIAGTAARVFEVEPRPDEEKIFALLEANVRHHPFIYGSACAFEPGTYFPDERLYSPYVYRSGEALARMNIDRSVYDWYGDDRWQWFRMPKALEKGFWSDPYFDEGAGNVLMTTYSAPFFADGRFRGVVTVDIHLPRIQETLGLTIDSGVRFVIVNGRGQFVYAPEHERIMAQTIFEFARELGRRDLEEVAAVALDGRPGVARIAGWDEAEPQWVFYASMPSTAWTFISRLPERVVLAEARTRALGLMVLLALTLLLIVVAVSLVSGRITRPISTLKDHVLRIAHGDLTTRIGAGAGGTGGDEVAELARSVDKMADDLQGHIDTLAAEQAARRAIERELDIARQIQVGLLPKTPPALVDFDIAGWSRPAAQTGGDYFDWQPLPDGRLVISIADVTGHGLGPALMAAVCRAYSRASFSSGADLAPLIARMNVLLKEDLPDNRFVTFAAAILDPRDADVLLLSAGHGPLLYYRAADASIEELDSHGMPLAVYPLAEYGPAQPLRMESGDFLCLITDGFVEWQRADGQAFGTGRLRDALRAASGLSAHEIIAAATAAVSAFIAPAAQQDDLTAVVIKRR